MQYPEGQRPWTSLLLEVLEVATRIRIHRRCFLGDNPLGTISSPKASRNCLWWIRISQQPKTLLYSITDAFTRAFWGLFWNSCPKNFGKYTAKRMWLSFLWIKLHDYSLQPTTEPKTLLQITFLEVLRNHCKTVPFSLRLQTCRPEFLTSTKTLTLWKIFLLNVLWNSYQ